MGSAACPGCGGRSSRVHCYYQRCLADRPVAGRQVRLDLRARRLVCGNDSCGRRTFAEQIPDLTRRHARRTNALTARSPTSPCFWADEPEPICADASPSPPARTPCSASFVRCPFHGRSLSRIWASTSSPCAAAVPKQRSSST
ncbi:transposase family protein [Streptomyces sp. NPDC000987]|uniref:transposase family protein n=1 Tax=Streptomyces sp. NPDC000987 TaxID=3154374 RepID=UPI00331F6313